MYDHITTKQDSFWNNAVAYWKQQSFTQTFQAEKIQQKSEHFEKSTRQSTQIFIDIYESHENDEMLKL